MHIHTLTSLCLYKLLPKPYTDRDTQTENAQRTDKHRQIHKAIRLHRYAYRRYYRIELWLYVTTDYQ